jgi:prepilin-type N-terminal cleavage/methylation domain-containing protein
MLRNKKGFTLVEVIVVAVIVAILASVAVPLYLGYVESSRLNVCENAAGAAAAYLGAAGNAQQTDASVGHAAGTITNSTTWTFVPDGAVQSVSFSPPDHVRLTTTGSIGAGGNASACYDANRDGDCTDNLEPTMATPIAW